MSIKENVEPPAEFLAEIGRVAVHWSWFESILDLCLMQLSGKSIMEPRSWIMFAHMTFPLKMDILGSLINELAGSYPGLHKGFPAVRVLIKEAQAVRNRTLHGKWGVNPDTRAVEASSITARGQLKTTVTPVSLDELRHASGQIDKAGDRLFRLVVINSDNPPRNL